MEYIIEIIYLFLNAFFLITDKIRDKFLNLEIEKFEKVNRMLYYSCIIILIIYVRVKTQIFMDIFLIIGVLYIMSFFALNIQKMLESVRGFFKLSGTVYVFLVILVLLIITSDLFKVDENTKATITIISLNIVWIFISCCVKTKVVLLCNSILATINGIILSIWNFSKLYRVREEWNILGTIIKYEKLNLVISSFLLFTTITLATAAMFCAMKKYWEEKKEEKR